MKVIADYAQEIAVLERLVKAQYSPGGAPLRILEAGCGREWYFDMKGVPFELTGLDIDADALAARIKDKGDLTHSQVGDLRSAVMPEGHFDVIYNAFVLEHIDGAAKVLENFVRWLKPGGLLIVRVPDRESVQGAIARLTPHWFHVLYYRWAWKMPNAGKPGFAPYPTIYDVVISRRGMRGFLEARRMQVVDELGTGTYSRGFGLAARITPFIARLISLITFGRIHDRYVDFCIIARKA